MSLFFFYLWCVFFVSLSATRFVLWYAKRWRLVDVPNDRSSHTHPTPRGGGIGIAIALLTAIGFLAYLAIIPPAVASALLGGGVVVAAVGFLDDRYRIRARYRVLAHALAALWALYWLSGFPTIDFGFTRVAVGWFGSVLAFLTLVWMSNLYNFMDGIDGLAGGEAVIVGVGGGLLLASATAGGLAFVAFAIAAGAAGFLIWNWHPAQIFMGDVGSTLLGFTFGALALFGERLSQVPALLWAILLMPFLVDATFTTLRRVVRRERWFEAHRTFAYQGAVALGSTHGEVALRVVLFGILLSFLVFLVGAAPFLLLPVLGAALLFCAWIWWNIQRKVSLRAS